jgi:hypothetical protein
MHAIQYLLVAFAAFAISRVLIRFRRGGMRILHLGLWMLFWAGVILVALRPETTSLVANFLGVTRGADTALYFAMLLAFYLLFRAFGKIEDLDRQLTRVVRANALEKLDEQIEIERSSTRL